MLARTVVVTAVVGMGCSGELGSSPVDGAGAPADATPTGRSDATPVGRSDAGETDAARPDAPGARPPTWSDDLAVRAPTWYARAEPDGAAEVGVAAVGSEDDRVGRLRVHGDPALGPTDRIGPAFASEIGTERTFGYGELRARVRLARCAPSEDLVNGIFLYKNDGVDHDGNGITDNAEIDIEILCATPTSILMSVWTDYDGRSGRFRRWSRGVDLATGAISESPSDHEYGLVPVGRDPSLVRRGFPAADTFYEVSIAWRADGARFTIVIDDEELVLWDLRSGAYVPSAPMNVLFNLWKPEGHWFPPVGPADYPAADGVLEIDWVRYWD
jgi:hypothetical protein